MSSIVKEKIVFIVNPISGGRSKKGFEEMVKNNLNTDLYEPILKYTEKPEHASALTKEAVENGIKKIIAVGGDGTVNEIGKMLLHSDVALGIIPFGSGNGLARHMGIPMNTAKAIQKLNNARIKINDAGSINDMPFFCTCGMGFDAHIGKIFASLKGRGFMGYVKAVLTEFANYKAQPYQLQLNGKSAKENAFLITLANATQYGNNAHIAPLAEVNDGKLNICILKPFPVYAMPGLAMRVFAKTAHKSSYMKTETFTEVSITRETEAPVHIDGEPFDLGKNIVVKIIPGSLNVMV